jgi:hypothetical protein
LRPVTLITMNFPLNRLWAGDRSNALTNGFPILIRTPARLLLRFLPVVGIVIAHCSRVIASRVSTCRR